MTIEADEAGEYRGRCAEFCGLAHAHLEPLVIAEPPEDFARWLDNEARDSVAPTSAGELAGREVFLGSCPYCPPARGPNATRDSGPAPPPPPTPPPTPPTPPPP